MTRPPSRRDRGCKSFQIAPAAPRPASSRSSMTISAPRPAAVDGPLLIVAGPGLGQDPHPHPSHRPPRGRARRGGGELPRHHLHPPRRCRDAGAPCRPPAPPARTRSRFTPSIRSASPSCASMRAPPGSTAAFASPTKPSARRCSRRRSSSARKGRAVAARDLPGEAHAELGGGRRRGSAGGLCPRDGAAQLDRLRRSRRAVGARC